MDIIQPPKSIELVRRLWKRNKTPWNPDHAVSRAPFGLIFTTILSGRQTRKFLIMMVLTGIERLYGKQTRPAGRSEKGEIIVDTVLGIIRSVF